MNLSSLVISMSARELGGNAYLGSVFDARRLSALTLPLDLRLALDVVAGAHSGKGPLRCVARPEMFTQGRSLEWLRTALPEVTEHLYLSDGHTLKLIPGFTNHVFIYGLQSVERRLAFRRLSRHAPELWPQFASQVNSSHPSSVRTISLLRSVPAAPAMLWFYPFYLNRHSVQDSVDHVLGWGEPESVRLGDFASVTYLPLTECATKDPGFQRMLVEAVGRAYFDPSSCVIIRLPLPEAEMAQRITLVLEEINAAAIRVPRARPKNIFFVANDVPEGTLAAVATRLTLILHPSVEFWCYTRALYAVTAKIITMLERRLEEPTALTEQLYLDALGRVPDFIRPSPLTDDSWMALS